MDSLPFMELQASEAFQPQGAIGFRLHDPNPGLRCWADSQGPPQGPDLMRLAQASPVGQAWLIQRWINLPCSMGPCGTRP